MEVHASSDQQCCLAQPSTQLHSIRALPMSLGGRWDQSDPNVPASQVEVPYSNFVVPGA